MKRNLASLRDHVYDVAIIGGGIYGMCVAWDAALRGLSVALVEKQDFGHATSSNTLRVIHGGLRYLQHGDIRRLRQSILERRFFMRVAPHLVHPLPFFIPTYGHLTRGKEILSFALLVNDVIGFDRNCLDDPQKYLPAGRLVSKKECLRLFPHLEGRSLTGGAIVYDCQMPNSERLVLSFAHSATRAGAVLANYVEVTGFLRNGDRIAGIKGRDVLSGNALEVRARVVINSAGPWRDDVLKFLAGSGSTQNLNLSKAFNLLLNRQLVPNYALGIYAHTKFKDRDALIHKGYRLLFITPWHDLSLIGTFHLPCDNDPDQLRLSEDEIESSLDEINAAYPVARLRREDLCFVFSGLLPAASCSSAGVQLLKRHRLADHQRQDGLDGLISVTGVKFTEARYVAEETVNLVFKKLSKTAPKCKTTVTPVHGSPSQSFNDFLLRETAKNPSRVNQKELQGLIYSYGSAYPDVLKYASTNNPSSEVPGPSGSPENCSPVIRGEILYAIHEEMAQKLSDVIFRRTRLGIAGYQGSLCIESCAAIAAKELGWSRSRTERELDEVRGRFLH